jgi:hypothetical protein
VAPHAHGSQIGEVTAAAGLGLDDVIDLGGSADADVGEAELAPVAVALEHPLVIRGYNPSDLERTTGFEPATPTLARFLGQVS